MLEYLPEWAKKELEDLRKAPFGLAVLSVIGIGFGFGLGSLFYAERIAVIEARLTSVEGQRDDARQAFSKAEQKLADAQKESRQPLNDAYIAVSWGQAETTADCTLEVDGGRIEQFSTDYDLLLVCGLKRPLTDFYDETAIAVSARHAIREGRLNLQVPVSIAMKQAAQEEAKRLGILVKPDSGLAGNVNVALVLFPKAGNTKEILRLKDVDGLGARVLEAHGLRGYVPFF